MNNNTIIDGIANYINSQLPRLTDLFGENIQDIEHVEIKDSEVYIYTKEPHEFLRNGDYIFLKGVPLPNKIKEISEDRRIITTSFFHHIVVDERDTRKLPILCRRQTKDGIKQELIYVELVEDIDRYNLRLKEPLNNFYDEYIVMRSHTGIINGLREIQVLRDNRYAIKLKDYKLKDIEDVVIDNVENALINYSQRVYGCFDLNDAIETYCNSFGFKSILNDEDEKRFIQKLNLQYKGRSNLTCYIELNPNVRDKNNGLYSTGELYYNLNLYIFIPIKKEYKYEQRELIEYVTFGIFNRILGNKSIELFNHSDMMKHTHLQKNSNIIVFNGCEPAIDRTNVLYIHKLNYTFTINQDDSDYSLDEDYWRLNSLEYSSYEKKFLEFY